MKPKITTITITRKERGNKGMIMEFVLMQKDPSATGANRAKVQSPSP